jgi:hypothetical protein
MSRQKRQVRMHQGTATRWGGKVALPAGAAQTVPKRPFSANRETSRG